MAEISINPVHTILFFLGFDIDLFLFMHLKHIIYSKSHVTKQALFNCITRFYMFILSMLYLKIYVFFLFFSFIFISWRLITLQYCSGFCHTLTVHTIPKAILFLWLSLRLNRWRPTELSHRTTRIMKMII